MKGVRTNANLIKIYTAVILRKRKRLEYLKGRQLQIRNKKTIKIIKNFIKIKSLIQKNNICINDKRTIIN